jgi:fimbrial chaperone protein
MLKRMPKILTRVLKQTACRLFFFLIGASVVSAGSIGVSPVRLTLSNSQQMGEITVRNDGTEPIIIQMEIMNWSQLQGKNVFTPTRELLGNPPIFTIPVGGSQLVRFGLRRASDINRELTYRIFLQELPQSNNNALMGTKMLMRVSMPVFVLPEVDAKPVLLWQAARTLKGALKISVSNNGNAHVQIAHFKLSLPGNAQPLVTQNSADYILPGQSYSWILTADADYPIPRSGESLQIFAQTDSGNIETEVMIEP